MRIFYWVLLDLALQQCIVDRDEIPDFHSILWDEREAERSLPCLIVQKPTLPARVRRFCQAFRCRGSRPIRPRSAPGPGQGATRATTKCFFTTSPQKIVAQICLEPIVADADRRAQFLALVTELLEWTFQEIVPPFAKSKRDHQGNAPFEWVFEFSAWCGKVCPAPDVGRG